jgi:undecaprenyl-diphosphatase
MLDKILLSTELLIFLNGLGSERFDSLWLIMQLYWTPFFLFLLFFIYKKLGNKPCFYFSIAVLITFTDQMTNLFKNGFKDCVLAVIEINTIIRVVQSRSSFSFFSGHASNSMAFVRIAIIYYSYGH